MENTIHTGISENPKVMAFKDELRELRKNGVLLLHDTEEKRRNLKKNKLISKEEKNRILGGYAKTIEDAKANIKENKDAIKEKVSEAVSYTKEESKNNRIELKEHVKESRIEIKKNHKNKLEDINQSYATNLERIKEKYQNKNDPESKREKVMELSEAKMSFKASHHDEKVDYSTKLQSCKDQLNDDYLNRRNTVKELRNGKETILESIEGYARGRVYAFKPKQFFLNNALYLTILIIYIVCIIVAPLTDKGNLLTIDSILQILEQSSTRMFYALGVAGLILLAGTDLSVGRMIALGSVTTAVILHDGPNIITFFGLPALDFTGTNMVLRVIMALLLSIVLCTLFSALAGFFTAKFKMHPFITTLSTQLLIYGLLYFSTQGTPTGGVESEIKDLIGGHFPLPGTDQGFPKLVIYAIIAIVVVWFIWNKTKFGKNMYAVGGNREAASVSGISVFWTTLGVFILAGILYGFGSFFESFRSNSSAGTGQGWELDAIAACVVGGISFNGGIGKIRGAVLGVIIFTGLTYCLSFLNIDTNLQFVFKGVIIMAACALDSVKYLKKK